MEEPEDMDRDSFTGGVLVVAIGAMLFVFFILALVFLT